MVKFHPQAAIDPVGVAGSRNQVNVIIMSKVVISPGRAAAKGPRPRPRQSSIICEPGFNRYGITVSGQYPIRELRVIARASRQCQNTTAKTRASQQCNVGA